MSQIGPSEVEWQLSLIKEPVVEHVQIMGHFLFGKRSVEAIKGISGRRHKDHLVRGNHGRDKRFHGMADEAISLLDPLPEKTPDMRLRRSRLFNEVRHKMDMRPIDDFCRWIRLLDELNEPRWLWIVNHDDIGLRKGRRKEAGILLDPVLIDLLLLGSQGDGFLRDSLQDIMEFPFRDLKGFQPREHDIPVRIDRKQAEQAHEGMTHQGHASTLDG